MWDEFRVKCVVGQSPAPVKLHSSSQLSLLLYLSSPPSLWCNFQASATVQFIYISPRLLLRRSGLCNAGCCASSLWPVLLILPGHALHLLWYIQTHIRRWAMNLKHFVKDLESQMSSFVLQLVVICQEVYVTKSSFSFSFLQVQPHKLSW